MPLYEYLFNKVLDNRDIQDKWITEMIIPFYKNKGKKNDPYNYRGIALLSCVTKLLKIILNKRIHNFAEENG